MRLASIAITITSTANAYHSVCTCVSLSPEQPLDRAHRDEDADRGEDRRLGERGEMLRLAVAELVLDVGRSCGDAHREVREERSDEVGAGVRCLGEEAEAVRGEADAQLEDEERRGGGDRDEG